MSFSVFGLLFIFLFGATTIIISVLLEPIAGWLQRRFRWNSYARLEWGATHKLQLQRQAHEALGYGEWTVGSFGVPVTKEAGEKLGVLNPSSIGIARLVDIRVTMTSSVSDEKISNDIQPEVIHYKRNDHEKALSLEDVTIIAASSKGGDLEQGRGPRESEQAIS